MTRGLAVTDGSEATRRDPARGPWPGWVSVLAAAAAGGGLLAAFPPYDVWWAAPVGVALFAVAVRQKGFRSGLGLGLLCGVVFFVPLLSWTGLHVGMAPWLLLAGFEASYLALQGGLAAFASPLVDRHRWLWPPLTALLWVAQEALRSRAPFGGFPWGRLAFSQGDSPMLRLAGLAGAPAVTFGVALAGGLLAAAGWALWSTASSSPAQQPGPARWPRRTRPGPAGWAALTRTGALAAMPVAVPLAAAALVVLAGLAVPYARPAGPPVTVAIVQGNVPRLGLDFNAQRRAVLDNHVNATLALADQVAAGTAARPDLVVWPENSSDVDPLRNPDARARIDESARAINAPILVGAVLSGPREGTLRNGGVVWEPGGGPGQTYLKRHPVPFAEYLPLRPVIEPLAGLVTADAKLLRSDFVGGTVPGVLTMGPATVGDVICFEVAYDDVVRDTVTAGAQLLAVQTNNATFDVAEAEQQLAMVRLRAVEHGRDSLMASTVGVSGFVTADGAVHDATRFNTRAVVLRELTPGTGRRLATRLGAGPELVLVGLAVGALVAAAVRRRDDTERSEVVP